MTKRLAIAALVAASALIAGCLQGCLSETVSVATNSAIDFYCHASMEKYVETLQVEKSRSTRKLCKTFQAKMQAGAHHSVETDHSKHSMGVNASLEVYCRSEASKKWETTVMKEIHEKEVACVKNLTEQVTEISTNNTMEWTAKYNLIMNFSFQFFMSVQMNITSGYESTLNSTLQSIDSTAEGVRNITSHITDSIDVYVDHVCEWINDDYVAKMEISMQKSIENACANVNNMTGEAAAGAAAHAQHVSGGAKTKMGIEGNISIYYEQECWDYNTEQAEITLRNETKRLTKECKTYVIKHIENSGESVANITNCAHTFIEGQQETSKTVEQSFQAEVKSAWQFSFEAHGSASGSVSSKAALPPALVGSLASDRASSQPVLFIAGIAAMVSLVLAVGNIIRKRRAMPVDGRDLLQIEVESGEEE